MDKNFKYALSFIGGTIVGSFMTHFVLKTKYEILLKERVNSVVQVFRKKQNKEQSLDNILEENCSEKKAYDNIIKNYEYDKTKEEKRVSKKPYIISPDDFGDGTYPVTTFTCYRNKVVTNEYDEIMAENDIENTIGSDSINHFGEYEDDSVFVRNDELGIDFEILYDENIYPEDKSSVDE